MEIMLITATPAEATQAPEDVSAGSKTPEGSFEDLLSALSTVEDGEAEGSGDVISMEVPAAIVSVAAENEIAEGEAVPTDVSMEADFDIEMNTAAKTAEEAEAEDNAEAIVMAALVETPFQPTREIAVVEEGVLANAETGAGPAVIPLEAEAGLEDGEEAPADADNDTKASDVEDLKGAPAVAAHDGPVGAEVSGFAVNPNTAIYNGADTAEDYHTGATVRAIGAEAAAETAYSFQQADDAIAGEAAVDNERPLEAAEFSGDEVVAKDGVEVKGAPSGMKGDCAGGENGEGGERAPEAQVAGGSAPDENGDNEAFKAVPEAPSSDLRQTAPDTASGFGANAAFGLDRAPEAGDRTSAASMETAVTEGLFEKLDAGVRMSVQGNGSVRIELSPEHLGDMEIRLKIEDAKVAAEIRVESAEVKALLDADSGRLKEIFNSNGLTLDKYTVEVDMDPMRGKAESGGGFGNCFQENASDRNGFGRKPWAGEADIESAFGKRYESTGKKGGIDIFA